MRDRAELRCCCRTAYNTRLVIVYSFTSVLMLRRDVVVAAAHTKCKMDKRSVFYLPELNWYIKNSLIMPLKSGVIKVN